MVRLEKCLDLLDSVISGIKDIFVVHRRADKVIGSIILNTLLGVFHLEVKYLQV